MAPGGWRRNVPTYLLPDALSLLRNIERQQQALNVVQMQYQQALNLAGEWLAEELGVSLEEAVKGYDFDGKVFTRRADR
jgi:hypothetical protein